MPYVANWQTAVQARILDRPAAGTLDGLDTPDGKFARTWSVAKDGRIALSTAGGKVFAVFVPVKERQTVLWNCYGAPANIFEAGRDDSVASDCGARWRTALKDLRQRPKRVVSLPWLL